MSLSWSWTLSLVDDSSMLLYWYRHSSSVEWMGSKLILDSIGLTSLSNSRSCCSADNKDAKYGLKLRFPVRMAFLIFCRILGEPKCYLFLNCIPFERKSRSKKWYAFCTWRNLLNLNFSCESSSHICLNGMSRLVCADIIRSFSVGRRGQESKALNIGISGWRPFMLP